MAYLNFSMLEQSASWTFGGIDWKMECWNGELDEVMVLAMEWTYLRSWICSTGVEMDIIWMDG